MRVCVYISVIINRKKPVAEHQVERPKWAASANSQEAVDQGQLAARTLKCTTFRRKPRARNSSSGLWVFFSQISDIQPIQPFQPSQAQSADSPLKLLPNVFYLGKLIIKKKTKNVVEFHDAVDGSEIRPKY